ncbi:MAG: exo-alpha-sialidase, partial [Ignavibacteriae bacterium]|nr:exo-alpha-sialidase [Ignavibacteriota bacterium]
MKNTITVLLAVFVLIICNLTFNIDNCICQWQPDVRLTNQSDSSFTYFASGGRWNVAANGSVVHVVWCETRDGNKEIYYKRSTDSGINWGADTRLTNAAGDSWYPSISVSGLLVHVIWGDRRYGPNQEICYKRSTDGGINWEADLRLTNDTSSTSFCSISSTGLFVHVMFHDNRTGNWQIYYKRSTDGGITWGNDNRLSNTSASSYYPSVSVSGFNVHVVWHDTRDGSSEIYYKRSTDGGINWSADTRLTNDPSLSSCAQIAVSGSNVHVIWYDNRNGNYEIYYKFSVDGGINWDVDTRLTNDPALSHYPCVAVLGSAIDVIWADTRDGNYEIYFKQSTNGGVSWGTDTRLTYDPAESSYPSIAVSGSVVHVVWTDNRDGNYEIYYKRNPTGNPIGIVPIN